MQWRSKMFYSKFPFRFVCQSFISAMCRACQPHHSANDCFIIKTFAKCSQCHKFLCRQMFFSTISSKETGEGKTKKMEWHGQQQKRGTKTQSRSTFSSTSSDRKKQMHFIVNVCHWHPRYTSNRSTTTGTQHCSIHLASRLHFPALTVSRWLLHQLENAKCEWAFLIDVWTTEWKTP